MSTEEEQKLRAIVHVASAMCNNFMGYLDKKDLKIQLLGTVRDYENWQKKEKINEERTDTLVERP